MTAVPQRTFAALFTAVGRGPELDEAVRRAGYPLDAPAEDYPLRVWRAVGEAVRGLLFAPLPAAVGQRRLGRLMVLGAQYTPLGWAVIPALAELGPERFLARLGWAARPWRPGLQIEVRQAGFCDYRLEVRDPAPQPEVLAGALEFWFLQQRSLATEARVEDLDRDSYVVRVRW